MARSVHIADVTPHAGKWPNLLDATVPGVPSAQVAQVVASYNDRQERFAIVFSNPGHSLDPAVVGNAVRAHLGDLHLGIVGEHQQGIVTLWIADVSQNELAFLASAAAAVLQCSWGWDESPSITVNVGNQSFVFGVRYNGDRTHTAIQQTAA